MNFSPEFDPDPNPYATQSSTAPPLAAAPASRFPTYAMVMFIISLVFCAIRLLFVALGVIGIMVMRNEVVDENGISMTSAILEVVTGAAMVLFGGMGNVMMLLRIRAGFYFGWLLVIATAGNMLTAVLQVNQLFQKVPEGSPEYIGALVGLGFAIIFRTAILVAYGVALIQFKRWIDRVKSESTTTF